MRQFIKTSIEKIRDAMDNNKLVIFVGAGVSANSNCPSWNMLINEFANELGIPDSDRECSVDNYLKIPQYYFIERGKKEYCDVIDKIFNISDCLPNGIHDLIFELKPSSIVTTNFDDLLEKTIKKNGLFYTVIKQDSDLPYCINDNLIIKMHGDSCLKNIVLKEEDYLNYSRDFPLIENYLKALFSTKTILLVGYSAEDPDFKLLFQWVKNELAAHFQPAYLLETNKNEDRLKFNYYKNRGINILYFSNIENDVPEDVETAITDSRGRNLYKFLKYIKEYTNKSNNYIDKICNKLSVFDEMNFIMPEDLIQTIDVPCNYDGFGREELEIFQECKELLDIINKIKGQGIIEEQEQYKKDLLSNSSVKKILNILSKAGIKSIKIGSCGLHFARDLNYNFNFFEDELDELLRMFKYDELANKLDCYLSDQPIEGNENKYLRKAYLFYRIGKHIKSYEILRDLSIHAFAEKKYLYYFIAQFNIKQLKPIIKNNQKLQKTCMKKYDKIIKEMGEIDIEAKYMELPQKYRQKIFFITKISSFNYVYKSVQEIMDHVYSLTNSKKTIEGGGISFNNDLAQSYHTTRNMFHYIRYNYIMVDHLSEVKGLFSSFVECYLIFYSIDENKSKILVNSKLKSVKYIERVVLNFIIDFVHVDKILNMFNKYEIKKINICDEDQGYLIEMFSNIEKLSIDNCIDNYNGIINCILVIFRYADISKDRFKELITIFIKKNMLDSSNYSKLLALIISKFKDDKNQVDVKAVVDLLNYSLAKLSNHEYNMFEFNSITNERWTINLVQIIIDMDQNVKTVADKYVIKILNEVECIIQEGKWTKQCDCMINNILMIIYPILKNSTKNLIDITISKVIKMLSKKDDKSDYIFCVYYAIFQGMNIDDHENITVKLVKAIDDYVKEKIQSEGESSNYQEGEDIKFNYSDKYVQLLLNLTYNKKIIYEDIKDFVTNVIANYSQFAFFTDMHKFNYDKFNPEWLHGLSDEELDELWKITEAKNKICELLKITMEERECSCLEPFSSVIKKFLIPSHK